jgi:hypothetical protein
MGPSGTFVDMKTGEYIIVIVRNPKHFLTLARVCFQNLTEIVVQLSEAREQKAAISDSFHPGCM